MSYHYNSNHYDDYHHQSTSAATFPSPSSSSSSYLHAEQPPSAPLGQAPPPQALAPQDLEVPFYARTSAAHGEELRHRHSITAAPSQPLRPSQTQYDHNLAGYDPSHPHPGYTRYQAPVPVPVPATAPVPPSQPYAIAAAASAPRPPPGAYVPLPPTAPPRPPLPPGGHSSSSSLPVNSVSAPLYPTVDDYTARLEALQMGNLFPPDSSSSPASSPSTGLRPPPPRPLTISPPSNSSLNHHRHSSPTTPDQLYPRDQRDSFTSGFIAMYGGSPSPQNSPLPFTNNLSSSSVQYQAQQRYSSDSLTAASPIHASHLSSATAMALPSPPSPPFRSQAAASLAAVTGISNAASTSASTSNNPYPSHASHPSTDSSATRSSNGSLPRPLPHEDSFYSVASSTWSPGQPGHQHNSNHSSTYSSHHTRKSPPPQHQPYEAALPKPSGPPPFVHSASSSSGRSISDGLTSDYSNPPRSGSLEHFRSTASPTEWARVKAINGGESQFEQQQHSQRSHQPPSIPATVVTSTPFSSSFSVPGLTAIDESESPNPAFTVSPVESPNMTTHPVFSRAPKRSMTGSSLSPHVPSSLSPSTSYHSLKRTTSGASTSTQATTMYATPTPFSFSAADLPEFLNPALLSHLAVLLRDYIPRSTHTKSNREYPRSFTSQDIINTLQCALVAGPCPVDPHDRKLALSIARSLHESLWFHEVDWSDAPIWDAPAPTMNAANSANHRLYQFDDGERRSEVHVSKDETQDEDEAPKGVLTALTGCYSPFCNQLEDEETRYRCYAYDCSNRAKRQTSSISTLTVAETVSSYLQPCENKLRTDLVGDIKQIDKPPENWVTSVPASVVSSMSKHEIEYQNRVYELIKGEAEYYHDLELLDSLFAQPLRQANPSILQPASRVEPFIAEVLQNVGEVRKHSGAFLDALQERQKQAHVFHGVGRIMLSFVVDWSPDYTKFAVNFPFADAAVREEMGRNPKFRDFLGVSRRLACHSGERTKTDGTHLHQQFRYRPETHRHDFHHFHTRATIRGVRYLLLLKDILKLSQEDDPDRPYVLETIKVIEQQAAAANKLIKVTETKVALREYDRDLVPKREGENLSYLDLKNEQERQYFGSVKVLKRVDGAVGTEWSECWLVLFDHYLVTTKMPREKDGRKRYVMTRRPVPLDLIQLKTTSFSDPPQQRTSGFHLRSARAGTPGYADSPSNSSSTSLVYPIHFYQMGRYDGQVYFYVESQATRLEWEQKFREAVDLRAQRQSVSKVIRMDLLAETTFGATHVVGSLDAMTSHNAVGKPTCSVPLDLADGQALVIIGCAEGLFIGYRGRPKSLRQVVALSGITQCAVLPEYGFVLVLANKVLIAYSLEALIPSGTSSNSSISRAPQRLSGQKDVSFFRVGKIGTEAPKTLIIYAKKGGVKESIFKALEPVNHSHKGGGGGAGHKLFSFGSSKTESFKSYKDFFIPALVSGLQFHRSKLALIGSRGVEIMDLEDMKTMTVPAFPSSRHDRSLVSLAERCEKAQALGMFRLQGDRFLLAYTDFAFHVTRHGLPIEGFTIEWESKPESVAFLSPYIFAFSPTIVEIRHALTGQLAQFITGSQVALIYDGTAIPTSPSNDYSPRRSQSSNEVAPAEKRLHFSLKSGHYHLVYEIDVLPGFQSIPEAETPSFPSGFGA
ncbi:BZ3500_MvSof-1268-A1-R1_Chr1-3g01781 [Microbotryum saponariae]|uniref:BZ3500_MvSof-1268-A1-R1_Chr1-3g01781 protein n=1 Tax=Microbotryum saponariae TaxID=289078 RepID=A0A2X0KEV9_9BASI|nr:BZ3500_MvSof-1268-A1-R1_Chr1-3g01781 [Microbotryum saponariae]SCZ94563.1 BZ3501_MvSof-1269-A2-R1_Chr1-3g01383 [Microbotryum saponariae]